jgi:signal transduction histidine kinase/ligand-binding sensor domain-containing protein
MVGFIMRGTVLVSCSVLLLALLARGALALDPAQPTSDYFRTTFTVEDGLPDNVVNAILQSRDGFLWIGTYAGLVRFNGRDFVPVDLRMAGAVSQVVNALAEGPDGSLWVGTDLGIVRIYDVEHYEPGRSRSQFYRLSAKDETALCLKLTREGVLFAGTSHGLYRLSGTSFILVLPANSVGTIEEGSDGHLLIVAHTTFLEWDRGKIITHRGLETELAPSRGKTSHEVPNDVFRHVMEDHTGAMWFCTRWGIARENRDAIYRYRPYGERDATNPILTYEDGRGTVWVVRDVGVFRADQESLEPLLTGVAPRSIFADRDGNLWIGTNGDGLIRFRDKYVHMFTTANGLPNNVPMTVIERHDGTIWAGNNCGGLSRFDQGHFVTYSEKDGLLNSCVWALAEDANEDLWVGTWGGGAFRFKDGRFEQYAQAQGLPSNIVRSIAAAPDGALWFATDGGLTRMRNGQLRNYSTADGLSSNHTISVYVERRGEILAATAAGIDRMIGDRFSPLSSAQQLLDQHFIGFGETQSGELYAFSAPHGISRIEGNRLVDIGLDFDLLGMAEFHGQDLWFSSRNGILRVPATSPWLSSEDRSGPLDYAKFGRADGLNSTQCSIGTPNIIIDRDNRLWVPTVQGLAMIDLLRLPHQSRRPTVYIEQVTVDRRTQLLPHQMVLSPGTHHLELKFDAIELTSPERIRFQYRLDGVDDSWLDAGVSRTAIYTSVPIGTHWFHVRASDSNGVWSRESIAHAITQQPFFYQTTLFRLIAVAVFVGLCAGIYRLRIRQIAAGMSARFDERLAERTRIARDLHDTLLQTIQGGKLVTDDALDCNTDQERMRSALQRLSGWLGQAIEESRSAVDRLRSSTTQRNDLAEALRSAGEDCTVQRSIEFHLSVTGASREVHPIIRDEVYRIGYEAIRNASLHADASRLDLQLSYVTDLVLRLRDNGKGIDPAIAEKGKQGHFGLIGMYERASRVRGQLTISGSPAGGTIVELVVPAMIAFPRQALGMHGALETIRSLFKRGR